MKLTKLANSLLLLLIASASLAQALQLTESYVGNNRAAVTVPQINGVAAWGDLHGNAGNYVSAHEEYRQDIAVAGRNAAGDVVTAVYRAISVSNVGNFAPPSANEADPTYSQNLSPAVDGDSIAWCDYNKDGFPDLAVTGALADGSRKVVLYVNRERQGAVAVPYRELVYDELTSIRINNSAPGTTVVLWMDYDNDGDSDLLTSGLVNGTQDFVTRLFSNNGPDGLNLGTTFHLEADASADLPQAAVRSARVRDFDQDSDLDLLISDFYGNVTVIENSGNGTFSQFAQPCQYGQNGNRSGLPGKSAWVDLNSDRYPDIVVFGRIAGQPVARFALNIAAHGGGRAFDVPVAIANPIGGVGEAGQLEIGDMDHDGKSDMVVAGFDANNEPAFRIYRSVVTNGEVSVEVDEDSALYLPRTDGAEPVDVSSIVADGGWSSLSLGDFFSSNNSTSTSLDVLLLGINQQTPVGQLLTNTSSANSNPVFNPNVSSQNVTLQADGNLRFEWEENQNNVSSDNTKALRVRYEFQQPDLGERYAISAGSYRSQRLTLPQMGNSAEADFWIWKNHQLRPGDRLYWELASVSARFNSPAFNASNSPGQGVYRLPYFAKYGDIAQISNAISEVGGTAWADIDGDGDVDGVVGGGSGVQLWMNLGDGNFAAPLVVPNFGNAARYEWGDVDGNGKMDLLVAQYVEQGVQLRAGIFRCTGGVDRNVTFAAYESLGMDFTCIDAKFADCDQDGDLDVGVLRGDNMRSMIVFNDGPANANQPVGAISWRATNGPARLVSGISGSISWADIDSDGQPDLMLSGKRHDANWSAPES